MSELFDNYEFHGIGNHLKWKGNVQPTPSSVIYSVEIEYLVGQSRPNVRVVNPELVDSKPMSLTHRFKDGSLCLHTREQWTADKYVAEFIVPWIPVWLVYYEGWLITGEWEGGGVHPGT